MINIDGGVLIVMDGYSATWIEKPRTCGMCGAKRTKFINRGGRTSCNYCDTLRRDEGKEQYGQAANY